MTRHVIAKWASLYNEGPILVAQCDLPDAEHVRVTRHPDGSFTAVPMRRVGPSMVKRFDPWWVDAPGEDA